MIRPKAIVLGARRRATGRRARGCELEIAVAAGIVDRETLAAAGELLEAHVRLEERELFPLIEELVPDDELRRLGLASRDATCAVWRPPLTS
jgi:hypothetical protein